MSIAFAPRCWDMGRRQGIPNKLKYLPTNFGTLRTISRICEIYSTILQDVEQLDPGVVQPEAKAIFRIVDEVKRKLFQKTLDRAGSDGSSAEEIYWLQNLKSELHRLQAILSRNKQHFDGTGLSPATPIELLCRLVGVQLGRPGWDIDNYVDQLGNLKVSRLLADAYHCGNSYWGYGLPVKLFICVGPHEGGVHVIASSADRFEGLNEVAKWANHAHSMRKEQHHEELKHLQAHVDLFYGESKPFMGDEVELWNFIHRWKINNTPRPSAANSTLTNFDETAAALDVASGFVVCAGCLKCRAVHTYKLSAKSIGAECNFPKSLRKPIPYTSCSCCEDLGSLFCLSTRRTAGQDNIPS